MSLPSPRKSILIVSQFYAPDITAAAFRIKETAEILAGLGHPVTVLTAEPHKGEAAANRPPAGRPAADGPVRVIRVPITKYTGGGTRDYLTHYVSFLVNAVRFGASAGLRPDIVWASSPPLFVGVAGILLARILRADFTLDVRDLWPDSAVTVGQIRRPGLLYNLACRVENRLYRQARFISCVAGPMAEHIRQRTTRPVMVLYNGIPEGFLSGCAERKPETKQLPEDGKINIMYVGNMGYCQNLPMTLEAAELFLDKKMDDIRIHLIGTGVERPLLERRLRERNLYNVELRGPVPKSEAMALMKEASALFLQLKDDGTMAKTIPSKVFDYLAVGRPILYGIKGEGAAVLAETGANLAFDPDSPLSFVQAVTAFCDHRPNLTARAVGNTDLVRRRFLRENLVKKLSECFQSSCRFE
jgi:glycosyltransferase involved in cell wall biosynthesis